MKVDFQEIYSALKIMKKNAVYEMAKVKRQQWFLYEKKGELPSRILFRLAEMDRKILKVLPRDFFLYNSFAVRINMIYHDVGIYTLAENIEHSVQKVRYMIDGFYPCYEQKEGLKAAFYDDMLVPVVAFPGGYKLVTTMDTERDEENIGNIDKVIIPVTVENPRNYETDTIFNRVISHIYNTHNMKDYRRKRDITELKEMCKKTDKPANVILTRYDETRGVFTVIDTRKQ